MNAEARLGIPNLPTGQGNRESDDWLKRATVASPPGPLGGAAADDGEPGLGRAVGRGQAPQAPLLQSGCLIAVGHRQISRTLPCCRRWLGFAVGEDGVVQL